MFNLLIYIFDISQFYKTFVVFSSTSLVKGRVAQWGSMSFLELKGWIQLVTKLSVTLGQIKNMAVINIVFIYCVSFIVFIVFIYLTRKKKIALGLRWLYTRHFHPA